MSLIDDALKKTQSALKQKPVVSSDAASSQEKAEIPRPIINPKINAVILDRKKRRYFSEEKKDFILSFFKSRYIVFTALIIIAGIALVLPHDKLHHIAKKDVQFYEDFFASLPKSPKSVITKTPEPLALSVAPLSSLSLDGTLESGKERAALINNQLYHAGETIGGYTIKQINYNQVILVDPNTHQTRILKTTLHP